MQALLELDCIPAGMELFPAASDDQWTIIKKVIDDCDYYLVISAGRYGSIGPNGKSYTQMEYEYAVSLGKPVIGFLHTDPTSISVAKTEATVEGKAALEAFRALVRHKAVRTFINASDLGSVVSRSIVKLMKTHPAIGWIRADSAVSVVSASEVLRLRRQIDELTEQLRKASQQPPIGAGELAQGDDTFTINFDITYNCQRGKDYTWSRTAELTWNEIAKVILPVATSEAKEQLFREVLEKKAFNQVHTSLKKSEKQITDLVLTIQEEDFRTILIQLEALGLLEKVQNRGYAPTWKPTSYGESQLIQLYAIPRDAE